jgi:tetratricopeptide (TPR) repeat protein
VPTVLNSRSFLGTFGLVVLAIAALWIADTFLARIEDADSQAQAERFFQQGRDLLKRGQNKQAIERIEDAIAIQRTNRRYLQALAEAQYAAGRFDDSQATLSDLLASDPTDGVSSLWMARIAAEEGRFADAVSYFHRAIYGHWYEHESENRRRARFELIDFLAKHNSKEELLAELLPVQDYAPKDLQTHIRLGKLFLTAGSPARASDEFHEVLHDDSSNAAAHEGIGEADFARGNYRAAQHDFQTALRLAPNDQTTRQRLELCNELLLLDPTLRGLDAEERYRRSVKLVELTLAEVNKCTANNTPELQALFDKAAVAMETKVKPAHQNEAAEANLDLAAQLWQLRKKECKAVPAADSPLTLVLTRMAQ